MPQVFTSPFGRQHTSSNSDNSDGDVSPLDICSYAYGSVRPYFCDELWTVYTHSCSETDTECLAIGRVSIHAMRRLGEFQKTYPNATIDLLVVASSNDIAISRGGLTFDGKRGFDVITFFRARSCSDGGDCTTQVLEDYRYEGETMMTDILSWYPIVVTLRGAAQSYYWLRMVMLIGGCYFAVAGAETDPDSVNGAHRTSFFRRVRRATVVLLKIPSQVIIYGSAFPLVGNVLAHMVDSPVVYELMGQKFDSFNGLLQLSLMELITASSLQMRNVWVLAIVVHVVVRFSTQRRWSPTQGVWRMPQFSIALISSLTIFSQFRFLSLRWTPVRTIQEVEVTTRLHPMIEELFHVNGGGGKASLGGVFLDAKAITYSVVVLGFLITALSLAVNRALKRMRVEFASLREHTTVPLTAGVLWPTTALAVAWKDDLFRIHHVSDFALNQSRLYSTKIQPSKPQPEASPVKCETLDDRSEADEAAMYLMNITMLSDPLAFLLWRRRSSTTLIGYYRSSETQHVYLIPLVHVSHQSELDWEGFTLERVVAADELTWSEIITCG
ncbi:hypothetical protein Gpo141_00007469 [Globisporangium polare]